jgi:hypothetical protein
MPWTAESTLVSGSDMLGGFAGSCLDQVIEGSLQPTDGREQPALRWREHTRQETGDGRQRRETRGIGALFLPLETCVDG